MTTGAAGTVVFFGSTRRALLDAVESSLTENAAERTAAFG
jgi:hypothetical protein